jgi:von Willebrand factor type A domain
MHLLLTPRWNDYPLHVQFGVLLLAALPILLVLWLYGYEMRLVKRSTAIRLLTLRLFVLAFLLFIALLQPIVVRTTTEEFPGRVVIAVDRSDSMDVIDPQRPLLDKLRLARALHLAGDLVPDAQLDTWIKQVEEKGEPTWVAANEAANDAAERRRLEQDRHGRFRLVCLRADDLTRSQVAERVLAESGGRLLPTVGGKHQVELDGFTTKLWEVKPDQADEFFRKRLAGGSGTDLGLPLAHALERAASDQGKLLGVVLLTDGQHNWGASPVAKAQELRGQGIKIYPVALGARQPPPVIAIAEVQAPPTVFKDVDIDIQARVQISGLPAQEIVVELQRPGLPPLSERIKHDGSDRAYVVSFRVRMDKAGTHALKLVAKQLPGATNAVKVRTENAERRVVVNVADDRAKVLLIDGEARYEYHYLATALARDRTMQVKRVVFQQPRLGKLPEEELEKLGNPALKLPTEPDALAAYDCIILGDVSPEQLPLPDRIRLEKYVADRGGTLVLLAGKRFMPLGYTKLFDPANELDPLLKLLPIVNERAYDSADGFKVTLTEEGQQVPFLQMETTPEKSRERWALLPPHHWAVIGEAKPGAVPLASFAEDRAGARPVAGLQMEALVPGKTDVAQDPARKRALMVRQNYGFGRVLYVGLDSTWRWRFKVGDTYHHRFWGQAIRWAASDKPLIAGNEYVRFGSREPVYRQGQEVDVVVRLGDDVTPPRPDSLAGARIVRAADKNPSEDAVALVPLKRPDAQPGALEGKVRDLAPGDYFIELAIPELADKLIGPAGTDGQPTKLKAQFTVTPRDNAEMIDLGTNWPLLEEIAAKSDGKVYTPENVAELGNVLVAAAVKREVPTERKLWQEWGTLVLFLVFLSAEWIGRKIAGLP